MKDGKCTWRHIHTVPQVGNTLFKCRAIEERRK
jgi:hypothetical protein